MRSQTSGVNLGGWLIAEKWLTPSVFTGTAAEDEWSLGQTTEGRRRIAAHRKSFMREDDFRWLEEYGVTFIRLPVPYWAVVDTDEYVSAKHELAWAVKMAEKYHLKVLLDLHAVPGGQNGGDHSGQKGQMEWFNSREYQEQTIIILRSLAEQFKDSPALWGIEIMNEPDARGHWWQLVRFYRRAYKELRNIIHPGTYTVFHDGFRPLIFTGSLWSRRKYPVAMDVHWYGFPLKRVESFQAYLRYSRLLRVIILWWVQLWQPVVVGEWSSVLPQRFFEAVPQKKHTRLLADNIEMQQKVYCHASGDMYWNYKAEGEGMWNFRSLVEKGALDLD